MELGSSCVCVLEQRTKKSSVLQRAEEDWASTVRLHQVPSLCLQAEVEDPIYRGSMNQQDQLKVVIRQAKAGGDRSLAVWVGRR